MNKTVEAAIEGQIVKLVKILKASPNAVLMVVEDGSGWGLYKEEIPSPMTDAEGEAWQEKNCLADDAEYRMESPNFNFRTAILTYALALALGLKVEPY